MKQSLLLLLLCLLSFVQIRAQETKIQDNKITVKDFYLDEKDLAANMEPTIVYDQNGEKCALIKVITNQEGFSFDVGVLGVVSTISKPGEYWVYVPFGVRKITLHHELYEQLEYQLPYSTIKAKTYKMIISSKEIFDNVVDDDTKQGHIKFEVSPHNANIVLNYVPVALDNTGKGEMDLYYGRYTYKATAENHYPLAGRIRLNDSDKLQNIKIRLKPNYGWINLNCKEGLEGADLYIDGIRLSEVNTDSIVVKSGKRTLRIVNPLYVPHEREVEVKDSTMLNIPITLIPNYGQVKFITDSTNSVYANNIFLGKGEWEGKLPAGKHIIECRAESHAPSSMEITVVKDAPKAEYELASPTPIFGAVEIETTPQGADVFIDNEFVGTTGETPLRKENILIGKRQLTIKAQNYSTLKNTITVFKDSTTKGSFLLGNKIFVTISSNPDSSRISIDGKEVGYTPFSDTLNAGIHKIKIAHSKKYVPFNKKIIVDSENTNLTYTLKQDYVRDNELYVEGVLGYSSGIHYGAAIGGYLRNVNLEAGFSTSGKSEKIYWNPISSESASGTTFTSYAPMNFWGKIGYGIPLSGKLRFTPQVGVQLTSLSEKSIGGGDGDQSNCTTAMVACRLSIAFSAYTGISFTTEYRFDVSSTDGYKLLAGLSEQINGYNKGLNGKFGFYFFF